MSLSSLQTFLLRKSSRRRRQPSKWARSSPDRLSPPFCGVPGTNYNITRCVSIQQSPCGCHDFCDHDLWPCDFKIEKDIEDYWQHTCQVWEFEQDTPKGVHLKAMLKFCDRQTNRLTDRPKTICTPPPPTYWYEMRSSENWQPEYHNTSSPLLVLNVKLPFFTFTNYNNAWMLIHLYCLRAYIKVLHS